jgi:hypothetical protein
MNEKIIQNVPALNFAVEQKIICRSGLFYPFEYDGEPIQSTWYPGWQDGGTMRSYDACLAWSGARRINTFVFSMNNEGMMSFFRPGKYMQEFDWARCALVLTKLQALAATGCMIIPAFFDGPQILPKDGGTYHPILDCWDRHERFISTACAALNSIASGYLIGCETDRYFKEVHQVEQLVAWTKQYSNGRLVGTHEGALRRINGLDFFAYEHPWHPNTGNRHSPEECVAYANKVGEVYPDISTYPMEWTIYGDTQLAYEQADALSQVSGVRGIGSPL